MKTKEKFSFLQSFLKWREKHITDKQFILILSFLEPTGCIWSIR